MWQKNNSNRSFYHDFNRFALYKLQKEIYNYPKFYLLFSNIFCSNLLLCNCKFLLLKIGCLDKGTQRQFSENICSEDDLRSRSFGTFVVKFLACLPLLRFSNI